MNAEDWLYALFYATSYKGLEHPQILVYVGILEVILSGYQEMIVIKFGGVKSYMQILNCMGVGTSHPCIVQRSTVIALITYTVLQFLYSTLLE